ncbi:MAG TPA: chemotaxis protein CheX [Polyangiaceae bacterium]|nr:chemotaxis protein CheX [Polyangiaceae bacterium]
MFVERSEATQAIQALAGAACTELLQAYGVELRPALGWTETDEVMLSGVMGFVGDHVRGTCLLAAPQGTIEAAAPEGAATRDWVGELANQLVGRLKAKLMARGATIALSTPVVLRGVKVSPLPRTNVEPVVFESKAGRVLVWLEVEVEKDFQLSEERALQASEGELLVF